MTLAPPRPDWDLDYPEETDTDDPDEFEFTDPDAVPLTPLPEKDRHVFYTVFS
jgi:hypothetical protein